MGGGARCFRSISPGDFLGLTPLCFQLGLGVILHARGIGWSCRLRRALGSVQKKKIDFHFHFLADWWLSLIIPPLLRSLCVDIGCGYLAVKVGEWDEFQHCHLLKRLTAEGVVVLFFFSILGRGFFNNPLTVCSWAGLIWTLDFSRAFTENFRCYTKLFLPFLHLDICERRCGSAQN